MDSIQSMEEIDEWLKDKSEEYQNGFLEGYEMGSSKILDVVSMSNLKFQEILETSYLQGLSFGSTLASEGLDAKDYYDSRDRLKKKQLFKVVNNVQND